MGQFARQMAADLVAVMKRVHCCDDFALTDETQFGHLDLLAYRRVAAEMRLDGFTYAADIAIPQNVAAGIPRLMARNMLSADGTVIASYYQYKPGRGYVGSALLRDIRGFKPGAAVKNAIRNFRMLHCMDLETAFDDGRHLLTTNIGDVFFHAHPTIESKYFPVDTPVSALVAHHHARMAAIIHAGHRPVVMRTADDILQFQLRQKQLRIAHREAVGWITEDELINSFFGMKRIARAVHREVLVLRDTPVSDRKV